MGLLGKIWKGTKNVVSGAADVVGNVVDAVGDAAHPIVHPIGDIVSAPVKEGMRAVRTVSNALTRANIPIVSKLSNIVGDASDAGIAATQAASRGQFGRVLGEYGKAWPEFAKVSQPVLTATGAVVGSIIPGVGTAAGSAAGSYLGSRIAGQNSLRSIGNAGTAYVAGNLGAGVTGATAGTLGATGSAVAGGATAGAAGGVGSNALAGRSLTANLGRNTLIGGVAGGVSAYGMDAVGSLNGVPISMQEALRAGAGYEDLVSLGFSPAQITAVGIRAGANSATQSGVPSILSNMGASAIKSYGMGQLNSGINNLVGTNSSNSLTSGLPSSPSVRSTGQTSNSLLPGEIDWFGTNQSEPRRPIYEPNYIKYADMFNQGGQNGR